MTSDTEYSAFLVQMAEQSRKDKLSDLEHLQEFVTDNAELEELEDLLGQFNLFEAIGMVWQEIRHSSFLAFLLDPSEAHGLGDLFLKRVIQRALLGADAQRLPLNVIELHLLSLDEMTVERERTNIDILLLNPTHRLAVIIENKVLTDEHDDQLKRYYETIQGQYPDWRILGIYLTPTGASANHPAYLALSYAEIADILDKLLTQRGNVLGSDITTVLQHYTEMLRRHIVSNPQIDELCRQIYQKHKKALDMIYARIPDRQAMINEGLVQMIKATPNLKVRNVTKGKVSFHPVSWDVPALQYAGGDSVPTLILQFYFTNRPTYLKLMLEIRPASKDRRQKLFAMAMKHKPPFQSRSGVLGAKWNAVYSRAIVSNRQMVGMDVADVLSAAQIEWDSFVLTDLPQITEIVAAQDWIKQIKEPDNAESGDTDDGDTEIEEES